ncbi:hypothetical protein AB0A69_01620 [Streptomyces sp. NPDC045431]|uniref:hypothetical protein n=1 Tax=Streptomyces sp. NPDC045431 TaxID=3155613 RepID=UPI0034019AE7
MTPYSLAFYVDVVTTGTVLGVRPSDSPERVAEVLGTDFAENRFGPCDMFRDHGLVEFFWDRASAGEPWSGHHLTLQVHRLAHGGSRLVNGAVRARYGRFTPRLRFAKLRRLLERRGVPLVEVPEDPANTPYYRRFRQPGSGVEVSVIGTYGEYSTPDALRVGDVYSIQATAAAHSVAARTAGSAPPPPAAPLAAPPAAPRSSRT